MTDAAAKLEEQRRRNRLAQRRRRERQRNRTASINSIGNDALPTLLAEDQDQQSSDKTWEFAVDTTFFDPALDEQDEIADHCLPSTPPLSAVAEVHHAAGGHADTADPARLGVGPESIVKGLLDGRMVSAADAGTSASLGSASPSPLHQFLMTLQKGDGELSQDSYSRLLAMIPQTQQQHQRYDSGPAAAAAAACKLQQPLHGPDFMQQLGNEAPTVCFSTAGGYSEASGSGILSWTRSESRPPTATTSRSVIGSGGGPSSSSTAASSSSAQQQEVVSLERIREFVEDAGFESLEAMMAAYYSANLGVVGGGGNGQRPPVQAVGRSRRLRGFLSAIHRSHVEWGAQERAAYREEIVRAAEGIYADELAGMVHGAAATGPDGSDGKLRIMSMAGAGRPTAETSRVYIAHRIHSLVSDPDIQDFMKKDRKDLQDTVADTWSLITQLIHNTGQSPQQKASNACIILYLLTSPAV
ncbi:hypothetical protein ISF_01085 [Cordyceps fumosorosea ARSEF 2679]|uniref:BZIP domain-containing protein n=1 Tax=Cordyceps fumosorosea (strain ARSEF 2679) TaxID=1081104 RepID=A0A162LQN7_CORFA|nr:hypothetical protein ISF_01085 [Cordyceps fumosorosea ARSEF 2679]OAA74184.1 hypothetical protein ISF_01085 [Cordyceps fumosorosea ARSEF 2679]